MSLDGNQQDELRNNNTRSDSRIEILIVGKGGEGVVLTGELLGLAATLDGKYATQRSVYGSAQRGEAVSSEIIISNEPIRYIFVETPTYLISMGELGLESYLKKVESGHQVPSKKHTKFFIDYSTEFDLGNLESRFDMFKFPTHKLAIENEIAFASNIIMLGGFVKNAGLISESSLREAIKTKVTDRLLEKNLKALELGKQLV
jgi:2-oxoglutarate ferredoxin oxidoreductase subunit gamma